MLHKIQSIISKDNCLIEAIFFDGHIVEYDVKQLFDVFPDFRILQFNKTIFENVKVDQGGYGISWNDELDLDAESIWENWIIIDKQKSPDLNHFLAYQLTLARTDANITQKELSEKTGIYQADISKIERAIGNPSLSTLKRLAEGLEMDLKIEFIPRK